MSTQFPIDIAVVVGAEDMVARIHGPVHEYESGAFHVSFSDGFADDFILVGENAGQLAPVGNKAGWPAYSKAIQSDLDIAQQLEPGQSFLVFRFEDPDAVFNVWLLKEYPYQHRECYFVFYFSHCRFTMVKDPATSKWVMGKEYSGEPAMNQSILGQAVARLEQTTPTAVTTLY